jgi:hypothetical protein
MLAIAIEKLTITILSFPIAIVRLTMRVMSVLPAIMQRHDRDSQAHDLELQSLRR